jgi:hypothetical protein
MAFNHFVALFVSFLGLLLPVLAQVPPVAVLAPPYDNSPFSMVGAITG